MNLQPINPRGPSAVILPCIRCGAKPVTHADLDGEPFKAYYCATCADAKDFRITPVAT